jgi:hypothetical protein
MSGTLGRRSGRSAHADGSETSVRGDVRGRRSSPSRGRVSSGGETPRTRTASTYDGGGQEGCPGGQRREVVHLVFLRARDAATSAATNPMRCGNAARHASRTGLQVTNPWTAAAFVAAKRCGEETVEEVGNLEDGNSRGRQSPGDADPLAHVVVGAKEPQEGNLGRKAGVGNAAGALGGAQACGSRPCDPEPQGEGGVRRKARDAAVARPRRARADWFVEHLEAVDTAWRERRRNEPLHEAGRFERPGEP